MIRTIEAYITPSQRLQDWAEAVFRVLTSLIFIIGGLGHFGEHQMMLDRMVESPWWNMINMVGNPSWLLWLSGGVFVIFGVMLALGWMTRLSALLIFLTLVPITITVHIAPGHVGPLFKNIAIMGSLFLIY
ncbi:MAG: DoxX family protein, partial [Sphingomonadales bacterium]|nr:DoxX family protein [Sphingomonadales bacterium]